MANSENDLNASDTGNTKIFVRLFKDLIRYSPELGQWYIWSGTHWEPDVLGQIFELTERVAVQVRRNAMLLTDEGPDGDTARAAALRHALKTESEGSRRKIISMAESSPQLVVPLDEIDSFDDRLTTPSGVVNLLTGEITPHRPEYLSTSCTLVPYDPDVKSKELERYLETFMPDPTDQAVLFGVLGTALRGGNAARMLPLFLGPSTSGKSQLMAAVDRILRGYCCSIPVSVFRGNLDDKPRPDLVKAMRKRIAYASEAAKSWELHSDQVKRLTGGDSIPFRNLYSQAIEAVPHFTPFIIANEMPRVRGADDAFRRRMIVVRFNNTISQGKEDSRIRERFVSDTACLTALLSRMIDGARSPLFVNGIDWMTLPEKFVNALADAFDEVDHVGSFLLWMTEEGHLAKAPVDAANSSCVKASQLHSAYRYWATQHGDRSDRESLLSQRDLGAALRTRGWESAMSAGTRWVGYQLGGTMAWL
jgi:P4 family phage/plasmid primase-like protien